MVNGNDFRRWQRGHENFMTPNVLDVFQKDDYFIELSSGRGILDDNDIFGVTVIYWDGKSFASQGHDFSKYSEMFHSKAEALEHIKMIKARLPSRK